MLLRVVSRRKGELPKGFPIGILHRSKLGVLHIVGKIKGIIPLILLTTSYFVHTTSFQQNQLVGDLTFGV
jgi:hypothetical protein